MKTKTIKKKLESKIQEWLNSIEDSNVRQLAKKSIVTGGSIASMLLKEKVNDYDIYFKDKHTVLEVAKYYVNQFNKLHPNRKTKIGTDATAYVLDCDDKQQVESELEKHKINEETDRRYVSGHLLNIEPDRIKIVIHSDGVASSLPEVLNEPIENAVDTIDEINSEELDNIEKQPYQPIFLSSNAITLSGRIQLIIRFYGEPDEIHNNYDFVHCTNYYDIEKNNLVLKQEALECLLTKELRYIGSKYPLCSIIRTRKFINRGFTISAGQYLKMCFQVSKLDLTDIRVLEDQLVGVDSAYFGILIMALQNKILSDKSFKLDELYINTIIDKIFN